MEHTIDSSSHLPKPPPSDFVTLSEDVFAALFKPQANHLNPNASFDWGEGYGTLFETYDEEFEFVRNQSSSRVWTLHSGDSSDFISSGLHFVNRIGYFVTQYPVPDGLLIEVQLDEV